MESSQLAAQTQADPSLLAPYGSRGPEHEHLARAGVFCTDSPSVQSAGSALWFSPCPSGGHEDATESCTRSGERKAGNLRSFFNEGRQQLEQQPSLKIILTLVYYCH